MFFRVRAQLAEALGAVNRWHCSKEHCRRIDDPDLLMEHFIRRGGAADFDRRFKEAMGPKNRWYCSECYQREVCEEEILWNYYMQYVDRPEFDIAC
jgi:hypothetical protein